MRYHGLRGLMIILMLACAFAAGCGGGGGTESAESSASVSALGWDPPGTYSDNAALDPYQDLDYYEIYVRQDQNFTDEDTPVAIIKAVTDSSVAGGNTRKLETEFVLENLQPFVVQGTSHFISLKAVGVDGQKSAFMPPVSWDQRPMAAM